MLASWLVEFYLSKCNELDDVIAAESASQDVDNLKAERTLVEDDLKHFLETYKVPHMILVSDHTDYQYSIEQFNQRNDVRPYPRSWEDSYLPILCHDDWRL
jgi:hypothetical protein